ncbi:MAG TPA: MJ0042-type zinc finger domain-containing protein [Beijerinckiaceae bacterium]|nr:MJ0042-type zinc finger domain-containing protein [Beijerinckiaceae bacterium]
MLIVCPSCASEYMIDPGRLGGEGRTVRCAGCKSTWFVTAAGEGSEAADAEAGENAPDASDTDAAVTAFESSAGLADEPGLPGEPSVETEPDGQDAWTPPSPEPAGNARASRLSALAGASLALLVCLALAAAIWGRGAVVRAVPATAALYASIGLPVNLRGLEFRGVRSEVVGAGTDAVLIVEGEIANISGRDAAVPPIEIGLQAAEGQMLYRWSNDPPAQSLKEGDALSFRARLAAPPSEARQVLVRFVPSRESAAALASQARSTN